MHRRLLTLIQNTRFPLVFTVLSGFLIGLLTIWQAWLLSNTIHHVFIENQTLIQVWKFLRVMLFVIAGRALLTWLNEIWAKEVAVRIKTVLRQQLFTHILKLGPAYTRAERTGELTASAVEGIETLDAYYSQYLPQLIITALVPISVLVFVFPVDLLSGVVLLITGPLIPFFMLLIGKGAEAVTNRQYETLSRLSAHFLDSLQGLTTLKVFGQSKSHAKNIERVSEQFRDTTLQVLRITFLSALALELLTTLSTAVIAVEIGLRLLYARMDFLQALFILVLAPEFYLPLRMLGLRFHAGMDGTAAARRIYEILDIEFVEQSTKNNVNSPSNTHIEISNLTFTYPNESTPVLKNINLSIKTGQHVALVGHTGAGKSTLVSLLLGFLKPTLGELFKPSTNSIAWVPQKPHLFHDTIAANLRLGKPDATREQLEAAAKATYLHDFILSLPDGYQSIIGEGGARLSGGQAQRLAIARAFLKDAPVLILDEPTSSLDPETEALIDEATHQLMKGKTVITIAHRLNTVFRADQIVVLDKGQIVERGTHAMLVKKKGEYARMVNAVQAHPGISRNVASELLKVVADEKAAPPDRCSKYYLQTPTQISSNQKSNTLKRLLLFLDGSWNWVVLSVLLGILTISANISLMGTSAWLISAAALHPSVAELQVAIVGVRFFGISRAAFRYSERLVSHNVTFRLLARLRVWFYKKLEPLAPARLMEYRTGDLLARIVGDVETLENFYIRVVSPPLVAIIVGIGTSFYLAAFYLPLATVLISFFLMLGVVLPISSLLLERKPGRALVTLRAELNTRLVDGVQGLADILAYDRADEYAKQLADIGQDYGRVQKHAAGIRGIYSGLAVFFTNMCLWLVVYLTIPQVNGGYIPGPMLPALALLTLASFEAVTPLPLAAQMWASVRSAADRLFDIVDAQPLVEEESEKRIVSNSSQKIVSSLEISNLSFTYPGKTIPAIREISFTLESGNPLAIVGPSGAGKSTIGNLLLRFWEYSSGDIRIGGESLHGLEQDKVRERCAVVSQSSYLFNTSVRENLKLGNPLAFQDEIEKAAQLAQIHELIMNMPKGYETHIGELGLRLSGGERQRLAIARALLKDAPILILDEPTANLDPLTEKLVLEMLFKVMRNKMALLITHRLVGLENIDEILVMVHGQIVERGTQAELLAKGGVFFRLWELQNRILAN